MLVLILRVSVHTDKDTFSSYFITTHVVFVGVCVGGLMEVEVDRLLHICVNCAGPSRPPKYTEYM